MKNIKDIIILFLFCILVILFFMKEHFIGFKSYGIYEHQLDPTLFPIIPNNFIYNNNCNKSPSLFPIIPNNFNYINNIC